MADGIYYMNVRIRHSGSEAQDKADCRGVAEAMVCGILM